jgi:hypothetical protein
LRVLYNQQENIGGMYAITKSRSRRSGSEKENRPKERRFPRPVNVYQAVRSYPSSHSARARVRENYGPGAVVPECERIPEQPFSGTHTEEKQRTGESVFAMKDMCWETIPL